MEGQGEGRCGGMGGGGDRGPDDGLYRLLETFITCATCSLRDTLTIKTIRVSSLLSSVCRCVSNAYVCVCASAIKCCTLCGHRFFSQFLVYPAASAWTRGVVEPANLAHSKSFTFYLPYLGTQKLRNGFSENDELPGGCDRLHELRQLIIGS